MENDDISNAWLLENRKGTKQGSSIVRRFLLLETFSSSSCVSIPLAFGMCLPDRRDRYPFSRQRAYIKKKKKERKSETVYIELAFAKALIIYRYISNYYGINFFPIKNNILIIYILIEIPFDRNP